MIFFRKLHKWLGLILGLQVMIWIITGTLISLIDAGDVAGHSAHKTRIADIELSNFAPLVSLSQLQTPLDPKRSVQLITLLAQPVYHVKSMVGSALFDARSGLQISIDREMAVQIAHESYRGNGRLTQAIVLAEGSTEVKDVLGPLWRVNFDDPLNSRIYISAQDGQVLAQRNDRWVLVDFLLMLHFMDYWRDGHFNNIQIIIFGFGTLWLALSGLLLVFKSFSRNEFRWVPWLSSGPGVAIHAGLKGRPAEQLTLDGSLSLYAGLSRLSINLPSNCDGSGSCGLCKINYCENAPEPSAVDRELLVESMLANGDRLACQHKPRSDDFILLPEVAYQNTLQQGEIISSRWLTPLLKEIQVRPDARVEFQPGDYFQFQIPAYQLKRDRLSLPEEFLRTWEAIALPDVWRNDHTRYRTYSAATAPGLEDFLRFTVRFAPPPPDNVAVPPGLGSSYMCSLEVGDRLSFRGPAGDFHLIDSEREKILIGGGAGMAPLKSMAQHLLETKKWSGKLRFWYGARNQQEILYREIIEDLAKRFSGFEWGVALSDADEDNEWQGERSFVHHAVHKKVLHLHDDLNNCEFYVCGPPPMLKATRQLLHELGVPDERIRFDDFGS